VILGLTGSLGSGKSTVASLLAACHATVICADELAHEAVRPGGPALEEIATHFGPEVLSPDGSLDRGALAAIVFADAEKRRRLERIIHPRVLQRQRELIREARESPLIVLDVPLLFESGFDRECDRTVTVVVDDEVRLKRLELRGMPRPDALARLANQMPQEAKAARSDHVIDNSGTLAETRHQVAELLRQLFPAGLPPPLTFPMANGHP
jgi:dephospho-CoA kinase